MMKQVFSPAPVTSAPGDTIICPLTGEEISPCCCPLNKRKSMLKKMLAALGLTVMIGIAALYAAGFHRDARATVTAPVTSAQSDTITCPLTGEEIAPCCYPLNKGSAAVLAVAAAPAVAPVESAETDTITCPLTGEEISPCCCPLNMDAATPTVAAAPAVTPVESAQTDTITCPLTGEEISPCCCPLNNDKGGK